MAQNILHIGFDVGSTTTKVAVVDAVTHELLHSSYRRHHAKQAQSLVDVLHDLQREFPDAQMQATIAGSGGSGFAEAMGVPFTQEVVANSLVVKSRYPDVRTAIELGGQDAKMVFFTYDEQQDRLNIADMRMNGSCAGGTGAFIDEMAALLNIPIEEFDSYAARGTTVYDVSGRCGVYAKTDIQPLLNQGVSKEDLALSTFHALARQTIGGLAQGLDINPPVIFEGGPLTFNPTLIRVFAERLGLRDDQVVTPDRPEIIVALGAALAIDELFADADCHLDIDRALTELTQGKRATQTSSVQPFFATDGQLAAFRERHALPDARGVLPPDGSTISGTIGIDSGSTTTKIVLLDEQDRLVWSFYASNQGEPVDVVERALKQLAQDLRSHRITLEVAAVGTTGYGEALIAEAFRADHHTVETVAHAFATRSYVPDADFILDIGGQDMKALWLKDGIITNIVVNEACSSGCGSFLEGFAATLGIPVENIADAAFASTNPADLGSRCTVFMNSNIITEQRNGKTPQDIMAGLCRSIILNVFTKVVRIARPESLGAKVVAQGGTFLNDAVLCAFEQYLGIPVFRAPYPGLMGAIGAGLLAKQATADAPTSFIGFEALDEFSYERHTNLVCPRCQNHCNRTALVFSTGSTFVIGNRCERGATIEDDVSAAATAETPETPSEPSTGTGAAATAAGASAPVGAPAAKTQRRRTPDLYGRRQQLLLAKYPAPACSTPKNITIGIPLVLSFWDDLPFWRTLFTALGFDVQLSRPSTRKMFENGLQAVCSDTVCFPAKLVHGHIRDLVERGVDRIFMPTVTTVATENRHDTSISRCAIVKGYSMVIRNSDNPARLGVPFDNPLFHWFTNEDRMTQLCDYFQREYAIAPADTARAVEAAEQAYQTFRATLLDEGQRVLADVASRGDFAVVLAGRPYHNDRLVNHDLPRLFAEQGVTVVPIDALPGADDVDLMSSRIDVVNNFHARMLGSAVIAALTPHLEFAQIVSFGCGHDAYLTDEITRMMDELAAKPPLVLKVDESDATGPLNIRVRSFVETARMKRAALAASDAAGAASGAAGSATSGATAAASGAVGNSTSDPAAASGTANVAAAAAAASAPSPSGTADIARAAETALKDSYPVKFTEADIADKLVLIPNVSHAFSLMMATVFAMQGLRTESVPVGHEEAIRLGKQYTHNDICFPAQIVVGEMIEALRSGRYDVDHVAVSTGKYIGDCRLTHYAALLRKALDDAGYPQVPIITNDDVDSHDLHPGFIMSTLSGARIAFTMPMIDCLEDLLRKIRPYEKIAGSANAAFESAVNCLLDGLRTRDIPGLLSAFKRSIRLMKDIEYDRSHPRPQVLIVGEYLLNFHPGANRHIEDYLERSGMEIIEARMTDVLRKTYFYQRSQIKEYHVHRPRSVRSLVTIADQFFTLAHAATDRIARRHPLYDPPTPMPQLVKDSDEVIHHTFDAGEGVLIPAEIIHHAKNGCKNFVILQPFGCLPNHVVGRGIAKHLKEMFPDIQILPLDYDPDVSFANIENRLQMIVMNARTAQA